MASGITPQSLKQAGQLQSIVNRLVQPRLLKKEPLLEDEIRFLIQSMKKQLKATRTALVELEYPVVIAGDTHGQYRDVLRMIDTVGWPPKKCYLFLGDYVDRGPRSVEVICLMFALRLTFPKHFYILRGNHEAKEINKFYGFYDEVKQRYNEQLWHEFNDVFTWMPLAALIGERCLCMHGGIPAKPMEYLDELKNIPLPIQSPRDNEIVADLLWSDPSDDIEDFQPNPRGLGHQFGARALNDFFRKHNVDILIRAHQVFKDGYKFMEGASCLTVFSAPNYGGEFENDAAALQMFGPNEWKLEILSPYHRKK